MPMSSQNPQIQSEVQLKDSTNLQFDNWGLIPYRDALANQELLISEIAKRQPDPKQPGYLIFCSHPPIVTLGRGTLSHDVFGWQGEQIEVSRGGRATYHGPSQLVIYPIIDLRIARKGRNQMEIQGLLRDFETGIVKALGHFQIAASGKPTDAVPNEFVADDSNPQATGVWSHGKKIASLGIGVRKWVSFHGAAVNVDHDPQAFRGMNPCGFRSSIMTSMEEILGTRIHRESFVLKMRQELLKVL